MTTLIDLNCSSTILIEYMLTLMSTLKTSFIILTHLVLIITLAISMDIYFWVLRKWKRSMIYLPRFVFLCYLLFFDHQILYICERIFKIKEYILMLILIRWIKFNLFLVVFIFSVQFVKFIYFILFYVIYT